MEFYENADGNTEYIDEELNFAEDEKAFLGKYIFMLTIQWLSNVHMDPQVYLFSYALTRVDSITMMD